LTDGALSDSLHVYQTVFMYAGLSLVLVGGLSFVFNVASKFMLPFLGAFSIGMYYWFAVPASFEAFGLAGASVVKFAMLALVVYWLMKALQSAGATPTNSGKQYRSVVAASLPK